MRPETAPPGPREGASPAGKLRVLLVAAHPTQYGAPVYRLMAADPRLEAEVAYLSLRGAEEELDPDFGVKVKWDVPLLAGYPWKRASRGEIKAMVSGRHFDAVVLYTGYRLPAFWTALLAARRAGAGVLFGTDAHTLRSPDGKRWKPWVKRLLWPRLFGLADAVIVPSSGGVALMRSLGIAAERLVLTPFVVDNHWWRRAAAQAGPAGVRAAWGIPAEAPVALFAAKMQPWKRPGDLLEAFARAEVAGSYLVYVGDGPLRGALEQRARDLGIEARVRFAGFVNQSGLPGVYRAASLLVLPSAYEAFGVVVNEAMLCGCPAVVSDRVGAGPDLVRDGETGFVYPCGDVEALATILRRALPDAALRARLGQAAARRMESWSPEHNVDALVRAVEQAVAGKRRGAKA